MGFIVESAGWSTRPLLGAGMDLCFTEVLLTSGITRMCSTRLYTLGKRRLT